jgi:hypothetical protein
MKTRTLVMIGLLAFLIFTVLSAPVGTLYGWFGPKTGSVQPLGLDGSLAEGRVAGVLVNGKPTLSDLHWRFKPLQLLLARAGFHVDGGGETLTLDVGIALLPGSGFNLSDTRVAGNVKALLGLAGQAFLPIDGQAGLTLDRFKLRKGFPTLAEGRLQLDHLAWTLSKDPLILGDFEALISTDNDRIIAKVQPLAGPLDVGGEIRLLTADRAYEVDLQVKPKPNAEPLVQNLVRSLGQPDTQGFWHVRSRGALGPPQAVAAPPAVAVPGRQ